MDVTKIYEQVNRTVSVGQPEFIARFNQALREIASTYDPKYIFTQGMPEYLIDTLSGVGVYDEFSAALEYGVLRYLQPEVEGHAANFMYFAERAYGTVYRALAKGKRIRREAW